MKLQVIIFISEQGLQHFEYIIDNIISIKKQNINNLDLSDIAIYDNYKYKCNCDSLIYK